MSIVLLYKKILQDTPGCIHCRIRTKGPSFQVAKRNAMPEDSRNRWPRDLANCEEAAAGVPAITEPTQTEAALRTVPVQAEHAAIAIDLRNGA